MYIQTETMQEYTEKKIRFLQEEEKMMDMEKELKGSPLGGRYLSSAEDVAMEEYMKQLKLATILGEPDQSLPVMLAQKWLFLRQALPMFFLGHCRKLVCTSLIRLV